MRSVVRHPFYSTWSTTTVTPAVVPNDDHPFLKTYQSTTAQLSSSFGVADVRPVPRPGSDGLIGDSNLVHGGVDVNEDERGPSSSSSTSSIRSDYLSRSLGLVLGLVACVTAVVTMSIVLLIVYRYRATATPSRRASLVSVTSLGYTKAPTTDVTAHNVSTAQTRSTSTTTTAPLQIHGHSSTGNRRPVSTSSAFNSGGGGGSDSVAPRTDFMGPSIVRTAYGIGDDAFMTSSMSRGNGGDSGYKTSHAKEWFV
jgi:hypothetical protein